MTGQHRPAGGSLDLAAVARDADLLDLLASRAPQPADDGVAALLAALAADVDDGLETWRRDPVSPAVAGAHRVHRLPAPREGAPAEPATRRHGLRASTVAVVLGVTLSVGGVAAAVTGNPLAAYDGIVHAVTGQDGGDAVPAPSPHAARVASFNHLLTGAQARIAHGDVAGIQGTIDALRQRLAAMTDLTTGERHALEARIAALEASLARESAKVDARTAHQQHKGGTHGSPAATPGPRATGSVATHRPSGHPTKAPATRQPAATPHSAPAPTRAPAAGSAQQAPAPTPTATAVPSSTSHGKGNGTGRPTDGAAQGARAAGH